MTVQQIIAADQKCWQVVFQESRGSLTIGVGLPPPLDTHLEAAAQNPLALACLTPLSKPVEQPQPFPISLRAKARKVKEVPKEAKVKAQAKRAPLRLKMPR